MLKDHMLYRYSLLLRCSTKGAAVTYQQLNDAIDGVKEVDPQGLVPRLLAGLLLADPTVAPSVVKGSKQEAMVSACKYAYAYAQLQPVLSTVCVIASHSTGCDMNV